MSSFFKRKKRGDQYDKDKNDLALSLKENIQYLKQKTGNSADIQIRYFQIGRKHSVKVALIFIDELVDDQTINEFIVEPILLKNREIEGTPKHVMDGLFKKGVSLGSAKKEQKWDRIIDDLLNGDTFILVDGVREALVASTSGGEKRAIEEPSTQVSVRGPRDGFTETLKVNVALIRRRIKSPNVRIESLKIGDITNTNVKMMYVKGLADPKIVNEVRKRLKKIKTSSILESGYVEQLIEDQSFTIFPTIYHTERPDIVAGNLLEGRIAILVDGTPFVLLVPAVFIQFFQAVEDYYARFDISTALRFLRILVFFISFIAPSVYIAGTTFHQEMIPTELLVIIAAQRENVPFPAFIEAVIMEVTFEILREAGIRMPRAIGSAISIVGALVIGQAAVQAGIVSPAMVIVVSITAIANFATPSFAMAISTRLLRFAFMGLAATFGFYGVILGFIFLAIHLCSLRSVGVPYMTPLSPLTAGNLQDTLIRTPLWITRERANLIMEHDDNIDENAKKPEPPDSRGMKKKNLQDEGESDE